MDELLGKIEALDKGAHFQALKTKEAMRLLLGCLSRLPDEQGVEPEEIMKVVRWAASARRSVRILRFLRSLSPDVSLDQQAVPMFPISVRWSEELHEPEVRVNRTPSVNERLEAFGVDMPPEDVGARPWWSVSDLCCAEETELENQRVAARRERRRARNELGGFIRVDHPVGQWLVFLADKTAPRPPALSDEDYRTMRLSLEPLGFVVVRSEDGVPALYDAETGLPRTLTLGTRR